VLWNVVVIGLILAAMGFALRYQLHANLIAQVDGELKQEMARVSTGPAPPWAGELGGRGLSGQNAVGTQLKLPDMKTDATKLFQVVKTHQWQASLTADVAFPTLIPVGVGSDGKLQQVAPLDDYGFREALHGETAFHDYVKNGQPFRSISAPVRSGGSLVAIAQANRDLSPVVGQLHQLDVSLAMLFPLALLVAAAAATLLVGGTMRPLRKLTESARHLDPELSGTRLPYVGTDEFAELAKAFNEAFDRTSTAFETQRRAMKQLERFTGDAGHELRTPLAAIKGSVSFLLRGQRLNGETRKSLEIIDAASDRMTRLIRDLLLLARNDGGSAAAALPVSLADVTSEALDLLDKPEHLSVQVSVDSDLTVLGDREQLTRAVSNLLANAFAYARGKVRVSACAAGGTVDLIVADDGEGVAEEHLPRLGERFYRPSENRARQSGGTGLGLAIVKSIVEASGGSLEIKSITDEGTRAILHLRPACATPARDESRL
jgi:signal transduction histidine kinase